MPHQSTPDAHRAGTPRRRATQERASITHARIIDAAIAIIERDGEAAVTVADILAATGLSRGAVYHHFADRDVLVRAAQFERLARQPGGDIAALRAAVRDARDRDEFIGTVSLITAALCEPERVAVRAVRASVLATAVQHADARPAATALESAIALELTEVVREGQARGFITTAVDAAAIAVVIESVAFGLLIATCIEPLPDRATLAEATRLALLGFLPHRDETDTVSVL